MPASCRLIFVTNHLPLKVTRDEVSGWSFEWDPDALVLQAKEGLPDDMDAVYVGCLPVEIEGREQEVRWWAGRQLSSLTFKALGCGAGMGGKRGWRLLQSPPYLTSARPCFCCQPMSAHHAENHVINVSPLASAGMHAALCGAVSCAACAATADCNGAVLQLAKLQCPILS